MEFLYVFAGMFLLIFGAVMLSRIVLCALIYGIAEHKARVKKVKERGACAADRGSSDPEGRC